MKINLKKNANNDKSNLKDIIDEIISKDYLTEPLTLTDKSTMIVFFIFIFILIEGCFILVFKFIDKDFIYSLPIINIPVILCKSYIQLWESWGLDTSNQSSLKLIALLLLVILVALMWVFCWYSIYIIDKEDKMYKNKIDKFNLFSYASKYSSKEMLFRYVIDVKFRKFYNPALAIVFFIIFEIILCFIFVSV